MTYIEESDRLCYFSFGRGRFDLDLKVTGSPKEVVDSISEIPVR